MPIEEHMNKIREIKQHISNSRGKKKLQYIKCLHRLQKELNMYYMLKTKEVM